MSDSIAADPLSSRPFSGSALPRWSVPRCPAAWQGEPDATEWEVVASLPPFLLADGSRPARQQTIARLCYDDHRLYVRFDCYDEDIWGHYTERDDPIYDEEVVELFLWPGEANPIHYYEFEISPNGVLFDGLVYNPTSLRQDMVVDLAWDCEGIIWQAERDDATDHWWAMLSIPWSSVGPVDPVPKIWRANLYRIERPRQGSPEFSCWSPVLVQPVDFHKPAQFGILVLND